MTTCIGDFIKIQVDWHDATPYGSTLSGRAQHIIQQKLHPTSFRLVRAWMEGVDDIHAATLADTIRAERAADAYLQLIRTPAFLHPPVAQTVPGTLYLQDTNDRVRAVLPLNGLNPQQLTQALHTGQVDMPLPLASVLRDAASSLGDFKRPDLTSESVVLVGHAAVCLFHAGIRVWLDPFFLPKKSIYKTWQPLSPLDLPAEQHCVLFTHSHPDHFDPASLLLFPANTLFFVPPCPDGESLLTLDMAFRLRQLGFERVQTLPWWENTNLGEFSITALPFYGEQAVGYSAAEPLLWNHGSTWNIRRKQDGKSFLFLADSGSDPRSYVTQFARQVRQQLGKVDYLFGNCRRWRLYPGQYITSSVPQYLLATPDCEIAIPQTIMMEAHELAAFAEICGTSHVFPYAMGGAPWFSELGLGYAHENQRATDFDADPREVLQGSQAMLRLPPAFQQVDAKTGSCINQYGEILPPPCYSFKLHDASPQDDYVLTLTGGGIKAGAATTCELADLATLVKRGAFVLTENFCEFWLPADDLFSQKILESWLKQYEGGYSISDTPLSIGIFPGILEWRLLGRQLLQAAHKSLLADDTEQALRKTLRDTPFNSLHPALLGTVYHELTGVSPRLGFTPQPLPLTYALPEISLPREVSQSSMIKQYSVTAIALALLLSKCLHNSWLTRKTLGKPGGTEAEFIEKLFATEIE